VNGGECSNFGHSFFAYFYKKVGGGSDVETYQHLRGNITPFSALAEHGFSVADHTN